MGRKIGSNFWYAVSIRGVFLRGARLGVRGPERVTGAWGAAARRRAHLPCLVPGEVRGEVAHTDETDCFERLGRL